MCIFIHWIITYIGTELYFQISDCIPISRSESKNRGTVKIALSESSEHFRQGPIYTVYSLTDTLLVPKSAVPAGNQPLKGLRRMSHLPENECQCKNPRPSNNRKVCSILQSPTKIEAQQVYCVSKGNTSQPLIMQKKCRNTAS